MLKYTKRPRRIKKHDILGDTPIVIEKVTCNTVIPSDIASEHLCSNEIIEVDVISGGSGICQVFGQSIPCKQGDIFVIPPDIPNNRFVSEDGERLQYIRLFFDIGEWFDDEYTVLGDPRFCYGVLRRGAIISYATLNASTYDGIVRILDAILQEVSEKQQDWQNFIRAYLTSMFITLARYIGKADCVPLDYDKKWQYAEIAVRMVMENFINSAFHLETLAESLHISKSKFSRLFKEFTGENFSDYLRSVRLGYACRLLRETELSVEHIVEACGMRDISSFYKNFQGYAGVTPSQYRVTKTKGDRIMVVLGDISEKMQQGRSKAVAELVQQAIDEGCDPERILNEGLLSGMDIIGEKFRNNEIFVPEVLVAARAMNKGSEILKPYLAANGITNVGKICLGTVHGDLHDIGKNLVKMMMEGKGIEVIDLGTDVPAETFVKTAIEQNCDVICCSALLTTTMGVMADVVKAAEAAGIRDKVKIMIGGAPVTEDFCKQIGADAYTADAASAANIALEFCKAE